MASYSDTLPPRAVATVSLWGYAKAGGAALMLGAAFGGGILFGSSESEEPPLIEGAPLVVAEERTEKLEAVREKLRLAFHEELTGAPREKPEGPAITPGEPPKPRAKAAEPDAPAAPPAPTEEATSGTEPPEPPPAAPEAPPPAAESDDDDDDTPGPAEDEEMIAAPPKAETEEDRTRVARTIAKVLGGEAPSAPAVVEQAKALTPPADKATFAVQIASTPSEEGAMALAERLRGQGHAASVVKAEIEGKGAMYRVRVGGFSSRDDASAYRAKLGEGFVIAE